MRGEADVHAVLAVVIHHQGLGHALAFVVATAEADGIDVAPVFFFLGMDLGIAVDLGGRGQKDAGLDPFGQPQHVEGPQDIGLDGLDRVILIVHRRGGTGQVIDLVHLQHDGVDHVVADQLQPGVVP